MNKQQKKTQDEVVAYIYKCVARAGYGSPEELRLPMTPKQRSVADILSEQAGKVSVKYEQAFSDNHQPTLLINDVRFEVGRPDEYNTGERYGSEKAQYKWWHEEYLFDLVVSLVDDTVTRAQLSIEKNPENAPDDKLKTATFCDTN